MLETDLVPNAYGDAGNSVHKTMERYLKDRSVSYDEIFYNFWYNRYKVPTLRTFNGEMLDYETYRAMLFNCVKFTDSLEGNITPEKTVSINLQEVGGFVAMGYIDIFIEKDGEIYIADYKTDKRNDYEYHKFQRLFYSWLVWRKYGKLPVKATWYYSRYDNTQEDSFTLEEVKELDTQIIKDLKDIEQKGEDINNYEVGDYDTGFNVYKTACEYEVMRRKDKSGEMTSLYNHKITQKKTIEIVVSGTFCMITTKLPDKLLNGIDKVLSYEQKNAYFIKKNTNFQYDGIVHLFNKNKQTFRTGLLNDVVRIIRQYNNYYKEDYVITFKDRRQNTPRIKTPSELIDIELRDYQVEAVESFLKNKYAVVKLKTGQGKSLVGAEIVRRVGLKTLWIINKKILVEQTKEVFEMVFGQEIGTITEGKVDIKDITIATYQTLVRKKEELVDYFQDIGLLINDETHGAGANSVKHIVKYCINTKYRLGLSATPDLKENWLEVKGITGGICYELAEDDDRNKNFLAEAEIKFLEFDDSMFSTDGEYNDKYREYIVNNPKRNYHIEKILEEHKGKNILIVTKMIEHANNLSKEFKIPMLIGKTTKDNRLEIIEGFKKGGFVAVGSISIISEGWDVPNLDVVIQASAPASPVRTIQTIGRALRKHPDKKKAYYYDFVDKGDKLFRYASYKRIKYLRNEGHEVNIIKEEKDKKT